MNILLINGGKALWFAVSLKAFKQRQAAACGHRAVAVFAC